MFPIHRHGITSPLNANPAAPVRRRLLGLFGAAGAGAVLAASGALARAESSAVSASKALATGNQRGLTGTWYNPATSGQGIMLEAYPDLIASGVGMLFGGWFTFDSSAGDESSQRWYSVSGELRSDASGSDLIIYRNTDGRFAQAPVTFASAVGTARITFSSCDSASLEFRFDDGRSGSIALQRILDNVTCSATSTSNSDDDFGFSGAWYDPDIGGQGLMVEVNPAALSAALGWYSYAPEGSADSGAASQRWFTGVAVFAPGDRSIAFTVYRTTGGVFNAGDTVTHTPIGTAELSFASCSAATLTWRFNVGELAGRSGSMALVRGTAAPGECAFGSTCSLIPSETEGPYPLSSVLSTPAIVRSDITVGKTGMPLTLVLKLVNINQGCAPIANAAVYVWHCDKDGVYSGYSGQTGGVNASGQTFCRGVQTTNANGQVVFSTIYPGWYAGRITHIHFQVYLQNALGASATVTSQIAFPLDVTQAVYGSALYAARGQNTSVTSFARDNVFSDGVSFQLANVAGSTSTGYVASLIAGIAV